MHMEDYYAILGVQPNSTVEEIERALNKQMREWTAKTNAPKLEKRQEAERKVQLLGQIRGVMIDPDLRKNYDRQYQEQHRQPPSSQPASARVPESLPADMGSACSRARMLLEAANADDARNILDSATQRWPDIAEAWNLLGRARRESGHGDAAAACVRAVELCPEDMELWIDLSEAYAARDDYANALKVLETAVGRAPDSVDVKIQYGRLQILAGHVEEGIAIIEECARIAPNAPFVVRLLAYAYMDCARFGWTFVSDEQIAAIAANAPDAANILDVGVNATAQRHVEDAQRWIDKALAMGLEDPQLKREVEEMSKDVAANRKRIFTGNWVVGGIGVLLGLIGGFWNGGWVFVLGSGIYLASSFPAIYAIKRRALRGAKFDDFGWISRTAERFPQPWGHIVGFVVAIALIPFLAAWNLYRNFGDEISSIAHSLWTRRDGYAERARSGVAWVFDTVRKAAHANKSEALTSPSANSPAMTLIEPMSSAGSVILKAPVSGSTIPETANPSFSGDVLPPVATGTTKGGTADREVARSMGAVDRPEDVLILKSSVPRRRTALPAAMVGAVVVVVLCAAGYLYWSGVIGDRPANLALDINRAALTAGFPEAHVQVDRQWVAIVSGTVVGRDAREKLIGLVRGYPNVRSVVDAVQVNVTDSERQALIVQKLKDAGLDGLQVTVLGTQATLWGTVSGPSERSHAIELVRTSGGFAEVVDKSTRSVAWVANDVRDALRGQGFSDVDVSLGGNNMVALTGTVSNEEERARAEETARSVGSGVAVSNQVQVVKRAVASVVTAPQTPTAVPAVTAQMQEPRQEPSPPRTEPAVAAVDITGIWQFAQERGGRAYRAAWKIDRTSTGELTGIYQSEYQNCRGRLTTRSAAPPDFEFLEEPDYSQNRSGRNDIGSVFKSMLANALGCGAGSLIRIHASSSRSISVTWVDRSSGRALASVEMTR
jgi:tetratricopeptide (TPR) repeat protein/osmotically-inducible protein OsmY